MRVIALGKAEERTLAKERRDGYEPCGLERQKAMKMPGSRGISLTGSSLDLSFASLESYSASESLHMQTDTHCGRHVCKRNCGYDTRVQKGTSQVVWEDLQ